MATKHSNQERTTSMAQKTKPATTFTADVNKAALAKYAMQDRADFHDVDRGFIAGFGDRLVSDDGKLIYDGELLAYIADDARPRTGQPEPVAPVPTHRASRAVRGRPRPLPGATQRRSDHCRRSGWPRDHRHEHQRPAGRAGLELFRREMTTTSPSSR